MKAADVLARYKPTTQSVTILLDGGLPARMVELKQEIRRAKRTEASDGLASQAVQLEAELAELEKQADAESVTFTMTALPGGEFSRLVAAHPVQEDDWEAFREVQKLNQRARPPEFHVESFAPALIGRSVAAVDGQPVDWDESDGQALWDQLSDGARADLWDTALAVNLGRSQRPLSKTATGTTTDSGSGSTTQPREVSATQSL